MLEIIKEAGSILKDLPDLAIWILVGILLYKVFVIGSVISVIKFTINKIHSVLIKPKGTTVKYEFDDLVYEHTGALSKLTSILRELKKHNVGYRLDHTYIDFINHCVFEKIEKENLISSFQIRSYLNKALKDKFDEAVKSNHE